MVHPRPGLPQGHGELVASPPPEAWPGLVEHNRDAAAAWRFTLAGRSVAEVRAKMRDEVLAAAEGFSAQLGVDVAAAKASTLPIVATGHQPELYHPGVWVKDFLLDKLAGQVGGTGLDVVVDTDGFDSVAISVPCMQPTVRRCRHYLAVGAEATCYACATVPSSRDIEAFCEAGDTSLSSLRAPALRRHFAEFCMHLRSAAADARSLSELVTFARRRYEATAGTDYLELPVTSLVRTEGFAAFVVQLAQDAAAFAAAYNAELAAYREATGTRSKAQPVPDLRFAQGAVEMPLWAIFDRERHSVWARRVDDGVALEAGGRSITVLPDAGSAAMDAVLASSAIIAPKALALTLVMRLLVSDLFIHGIGGARYDRVTDGICRRYFGVEPPAYAVASMTMYLPLGGHVVTAEEVAEAKERLNRLERNPDEALGDLEFDSPDEQARADVLTSQKRGLVAAIAAEGADRKELGLRIKGVNAELAELLEPARGEYAGQVARLEEMRAASEILTDRTYPFCLWSPAEVADKVR